MWVFSFFIPHCMHLVVPTHPYFFWAVCHSGRTFPLKEPEQESHNRFSPLLTARPYPLTSDHDLTVSCIGWVQAGDIWALRVPHFYVCPKSAYCSCVRRGLEARLHNLSSVLDFLWRELFFDFPFFYGLLPLGAGLYLMVGFAFFQPTLLLLSFLVIPFCHSCCDII